METGVFFVAVISLIIAMMTLLQKIHEGEVVIESSNGNLSQRVRLMYGARSLNYSSNPCTECISIAIRENVSRGTAVRLFVACTPACEYANARIMTDIRFA